jgi:phosphoglucosamine mutase
MAGTGGRLFGTDGVRGVANRDLTPQLAFDLARAAGETIRGPVLIGRDTRRSGPMLAAALQAGFNSVGVDTIDLGVIPVGAVSRLTNTSDAEMGVMVSASHNPAPDNGIKLIAHSGNKLPDAQEEAIEARYRLGTPYPSPTGGAVGTTEAMDDAVDRYLDLLAGVRGPVLAGVRLALDCANGAAHIAAPALFRRLGADVDVHAASPNGVNINDGCGATHPESLAPLAAGRVGFCFDGDADRLIAIDEDGVIVNGDVIMAILARHMKETNALDGDRVVSTVMANLGFKLAMQRLGIEVLQTQVGDRYVLEEMLRLGAVLGGEQSGHIVLEDRMSGDGLRTALRLAEVMVATGAPLRELRTVMTEFPQVLHNVVVADKGSLEAADVVWSAVEDAAESLGDEGRILVRASGTEPIVRVMVEAPTAEVAESVAASLSAVVAGALGG